VTDGRTRLAREGVRGLSLTSVHPTAWSSATRRGWRLGIELDQAAMQLIAMRLTAGSVAGVGSPAGPRGWRRADGGKALVRWLSMTDAMRLV
jgi:hypothetical protein